MKTMECIILERRARVCEVQLRAAKRALEGKNRAQPVLTITPESTSNPSDRAPIAAFWLRHRIIRNPRLIRF